LSIALINQDKLLKRAARESNDFKAKLEIALREFEFAKAVVVVSDETECEACAIHMTNLSNLQTKYASLLDENDELKSRPVLLGACKSCSGLQSKLAQKNVRIFALEKASLDSTAARCARCEGLELEIES
jgi:Fe-S cluster biogenesis protein NfuA